MGKTSGNVPAPVRYAVRQVLDQEHRKDTLLRLSNARQARSTKLDIDGNEENVEEEHVDFAQKHKRGASNMGGGKRDFFGRVLRDARPVSARGVAGAEEMTASKDDEPKAWVSFREGYSNAVRRPVTLKELLESF